MLGKFTCPTAHGHVLQLSSLVSYLSCDQVVCWLLKLSMWDPFYIAHFEGTDSHDIWVNHMLVVEILYMKRLST